MARSLALVVLALSLPLAGCASSGLVAAGSPGGGSGGSPLAGSADYGMRAESAHASDVASRVSASRDVAPSRDFAISRREPQVHGHLMCRNCR